MQEKEDEDEINGRRWKSVCSEEKGTYCRRSGPSFMVFVFGTTVCWSVSCAEKDVCKGCAVN